MGDSDHQLPAFARDVRGGEDVLEAAQAKADAAKPFARRLEALLREIPAHVEGDGEEVYLEILNGLIGYDIVKERDQLLEENRHLRAQLNAADSTRSSSTAHATQTTASRPKITVPSNDLSRPTPSQATATHRLDQKRAALEKNIRELEKARSDAWALKVDAEQQMHYAIARQAEAERVRDDDLEKCCDVEERLEALKTERDELEEVVDGLKTRVEDLREELRDLAEKDETSSITSRGQQSAKRVLPSTETR
ncbi:hypothetical protein PRZ48_007825 [Zasmidium cellare]|uniref:Uncharacterized protein n=1 Tax=Zasmidium cellare TaxID=395010 RepID=A0ABR0EKC5_ZASCE|nr:hypothetical protein PRZ48_007825 [Zasmidium cellare]